ncbi:protein FAR1-RELATED SEQUENCE 5-like [Rutidosis leptorrhynchoides]|uniref:protein FAR1-RELATED SEQUENCE 5-like n=1 Tax=Rutidosis leptorrhynchoides TaxID=125765 RepID=UPI003A993E99
MTYQYSSMRITVQSVFFTARHRLCMWHITEKITSKVRHAISKAGFTSDISNIVWTDKLDPDEFDRSYFRDCDMSGLMRTSSRSESENYSKNDHESLYTTPAIKTQDPMEKHACKVFTRVAFFKVQGQMKAATRYCLSYKVQKLLENSTKFYIGDTSVKTSNIDETVDRISNPYYFDELIPKYSEVIVNHRTNEILCNCKMYERVGYFFRHILYVLRMDAVPETIFPS